MSVKARGGSTGEPSPTGRIEGLRTKLMVLLAQYLLLAKQVVALELADAAHSDSLGEHVRYKIDEAFRVSSYDPDASLVARAGQSVDIAGVVLTLVVAGVFAYVGLFIMAETEESTDINNSNFSGARTDLTSGIETAYGMLEIVFIALLLGAIIAILLGIRGR